MPDLKTKVVFAVPRVHKYIQLYETEYECILVFFDMFINENMFSGPSNHFCQPTRRWPCGRGPRPWLQCRHCQCLPSQGLQRKKWGMKCTISWGLGYDYDYDQQYDLSSSKKGRSNPIQWQNKNGEDYFPIHGTFEVRKKKRLRLTLLQPQKRTPPHD